MQCIRRHASTSLEIKTQPYQANPCKVSPIRSTDQGAWFAKKYSLGSGASCTLPAIARQRNGALPLARCSLFVCPEFLSPA